MKLSFAGFLQIKAVTSQPWYSKAQQITAYKLYEIYSAFVHSTATWFCYVSEDISEGFLT